MAGSWCVNWEPAIIIFSSLSSIPKYTFLLQRKKEKNALRSKKKWFRWHFPPLQKAKIRGVKGRMKGEKRGISWYIFVKILVKKQENWGREKMNMCCSYNTKHGTSRNYNISYFADYHYITIIHLFFSNNYQKPNPVIIGHGHFRSFSFSGAQISPIVLYLSLIHIWRCRRAI